MSEAPALPFSSAVAAASASRDRPARGLRACVIGGGGSGAALAYDLALRGFAVTLLEKGELTSGTTGRHHGQLHCGARYALADRAIARECMEESRILRRIVPEAIEYNGGLFVELDESDAALEAEFASACREAGIPAVPMTASAALDLEPALNARILGAVRVPDGSFDAFRVPLSFFAAARELGADIRAWTEVVGLEIASGRVVAARALERSAEGLREHRIEADYFVSAAGAWAGRLGALAGVDVPIAPAPGTMVAVKARLCDRVVSRLHRAGDGDIIVPQRGLSIIGSTQSLAADPECLLPPPGDLPFLVGKAAEMLPSFADAPFHAAWSAARPLAGRGGDDAGRSISRDFAALDHEEREGLGGFCTLIGGKATVLRAMAEKSADLVCRRLGVEAECGTADYSLPSWKDYYRGEKAMSLVRLRIPRGLEPVDYEIEAGGLTLLDALELIRGSREPGLRYRHSCHHGSCGTCGALVDGAERLMCLTRLAELGPGPILVEPLRKMVALGDLAVDPSPLFEELPEGASYLRSSEVAHRAALADDAVPGEASPRRMENCIECGLCVSACPVTAPFAGPAALAAADRDREERPEREAAALAFAAGSRGVAACERRFACSRACPQGVRPGRRIENLRRSLAAAADGEPG